MAGETREFPNQVNYPTEGGGPVSGDDYANKLGERGNWIFNNILTDLTHDVSSTGDAIVVDSSPAPTIGTSYIKNMFFALPIENTNTSTSVTIAIDGKAAASLRDAEGNVLDINELVVNTVLLIWYDGTNFRSLSNASGSGGGAAPTRDVQIFTASGTWVKPTAAFSTITVIALSGGGGGFREDGQSNSGNGVGRGGYRGVFTLPFTAVGSTENVIIGAGGGTTANLVNPGISGGDTSFGSFLTVKGGEAGADANNDRIIPRPYLIFTTDAIAVSGSAGHNTADAATLAGAPGSSANSFETNGDGTSIGAYYQSTVNQAPGSGVAWGGAAVEESTAAQAGGPGKVVVICS